MVIQIAVRYNAPKNKRTKRLLVDAEKDVSELQEVIKNQFGIPISEQIIRCNIKNFDVRVLPGFNLDFYEIGNNAFLQVNRLELTHTEDEREEETINDEDLMNENFITRMETFNRLRMAERTTNFELQTIKEEEENEDDDQKQISTLKKTFLEITKMKLLKEFQPFLQSLLTLDVISQIMVLQNADKVGWTGVHYAVLYNEEFVIRELLKYFKLDILNWTSDDGWSPLFLAVHNNHWNIFNLMIESADHTQLEVQTNKGSLLHHIFKNADFEIIEKLILEKGIDPMIKDFSGKKAVDLLTPEKQEEVSLLLELRKLPEKPKSLIGEVLKNSFIFGWSKRILHLNGEARTLERYGSFKDYPFKPKEIIPLQGIDKVKFFGFFKDHSQDEILNQNGHASSKELAAFKPAENFMEFFYAGSRHEYKITSVDQAKAWERFIQVGIEWSRYYETFIMKIKNPHIKEKALKIWKNINKNFDQFILAKKDDLQKLLSLMKPAKDETQPVLTLPKVGLKDFDVLKILGKGAFGKVYKVLHRKSRKIFAMKVLRKKNLIKEQQIKYSLIEKRILEQNKDNPFLLSLYFAFQTVENLYMVIDFCPNEDLSVLLNKQPSSCFDERTVKFYMAEIILAIEDLHRRNYIYRDLKPENILIDDSGHLKLADFGLAAENIRTINDFAKSFCGSPIYISPEILKSKRSYKTSDYYTIGVVMYELLTGDPPFFNEDIDKLYSQIKKGNFSFPKSKNISESAKDFISKLLVTNPKSRLGAERGIVELKEHEFFKDLSWDKIINREIAPPIAFNPQAHNFTHKINLRDTEYDDKNMGVNYLPNFDFVREDLVNLDN